MVGVNPNIEALPEGGEETMSVTVKVPTSFKNPIPATNGVVEENDLLLPYFERVVGAIGGEAVLQLKGNRIMISLDEVNLTIQPRADDGGLGEGLLKGEVPQVVDSIPLPHPLIPILNQLLIHLLRCGEGPLSEVEDGGVTEVGVGSEKRILH